MRSLQQAVKAEDLLVVAREGFGTLGCEVLIQSAALIAGGSFVCAVLDSISIPSQSSTNKLSCYNVPEIV
jgi:hypothetical protein